MPTRLTIGAATRPHGKLPYPEAFARIAGAGCRHVALFASEGKVPVSAQSAPDEVAAARRAAAEAGLAPSMVLARTRLDLGVGGAAEDHRRLIGRAAELRARWLLDLGTGDRVRCDDCVAVMRQAAPQAEAAGLGISMKPHGGISLTAEDLLRTCAAVDHIAFGVCRGHVAGILASLA